MAAITEDLERAIRLLIKIELFQKLELQDEGFIARLASVVGLRRVAAGSIIFRQNDPADTCYIVARGEVGTYVWKSGQKDSLPTPRLRFNSSDFPAFSEATAAADRWRTSEGLSTFSASSVFGDCTATLRPGCIVGESVLSSNLPRAFTAHCLKDCELLVIRKADFYSSKQDLLEASEMQVIEDFCKVLSQRCGSVVKAWRCVLDPHAMGELLFSEFVDALTSLQWEGNTSALWGALVKRAHANNRDVVVGLREIAPNDDWIIEHFKFWVEDKFGGAIEFFNKLTGNRPNTSLSFLEFMRACQPYGHPNRMQLIWEFVDPENNGSIVLKDIAFLEINGLKRKSALEPGFVMALEAAKATADSQRKRALMQKRATNAAVADFMRKIRSASGGSFIRGYRRILDRNGNLTISKVEMLKGCRQVAFGGDVMALWKALDCDGDGSVQLPEVDVRMALVLSSFKKWCSELHGSCVKAMQHFAAITRRRTAKWSVDDFVAVVSNSGWPGVPGTYSLKQATILLHEAADDTGTKTIVAQDVHFLDSWEPTPWLCAEPDIQGKEQLIAQLRARYVNLIVAWRRLFDRNNKNRCTYKEFTHVCTYMQLKNAPGIWRALDQESYGFISLQNIDHESAQVLLDFKEWAEETFGTIQFAFRVVDKEHTNAVSLPVFKRMLTEFGFQGDARVLFQSLKPDVASKQNSRDARLRLEDMKHLSSWETSADMALEEVEDDWDEERSADEGKLLDTKKSDSLQLALRSTKDSMSPKVAEEASLMSFGESVRSNFRGTGGDFLHFCKVAKDLEKMAEVSSASTTEKKQTLPKAFSTAEFLRGGTDGPKGQVMETRRRRGGDKVASSPYTRPVLVSATFNGIKDAARTTVSGKNKLATSLSLPALPSKIRQVNFEDSLDDCSNSTKSGFKASLTSELPVLVPKAS